MKISFNISLAPGVVMSERLKTTAKPSKMESRGEDGLEVRDERRAVRDELDILGENEALYQRANCCWAGSGAPYVSLASGVCTGPIR